MTRIPLFYSILSVALECDRINAPASSSKVIVVISMCFISLRLSILHPSCRRVCGGEQSAFTGSCGETDHIANTISSEITRAAKQIIIGLYFCQKVGGISSRQLMHLIASLIVGSPQQGQFLSCIPFSDKFPSSSFCSGLTTAETLT